MRYFDTVVLLRLNLRLIFALTLPLMAFSGCIASEEDAPPKGSDVPAEAEAPSYTDDTGAVEGFVIDDAELPIVGASVGIPELPDVLTKSDLQGRFTLSNVLPGDYIVHATALGYEPGQAKVTVVAGDVVSDIEIILVAAASDEPYSTTDIRKVSISGLMWKLSPSCIYTDINPLAKTCGGVRLECAPSTDDCEVHYGSEKDFTDEWVTLIGEVTWQAQSGATGKGFSYDINAPNITRGSGGSINGADPHQFQLASGAPPIRIQVDEAALTAKGVPPSDWDNMKDCETGNCDWFWRIFPAACDLGICPSGTGPDYGVMYQNPVEIYFTYFIKAPAPAGYTALPPS